MIFIFIFSIIFQNFQKLDNFFSSSPICDKLYILVDISSTYEQDVS